MTLPHSSREEAAHATCLQRLATALSGYSDLDVAVLTHGAVPSLAVRNNRVPAMSEIVTMGASDAGPVYLWSWGRRIGNPSDPDSAAHAIAYVLAAGDARAWWVRAARPNSGNFRPPV